MPAAEAPRRRQRSVHPAVLVPQHQRPDREVVQQDLAGIVAQCQQVERRKRHPEYRQVKQSLHHERIAAQQVTVEEDRRGRPAPAYSVGQIVPQSLAMSITTHPSAGAWSSALSSRPMSEFRS